MNPRDLSDKTYLITGANSGIGKAAAQQLAARGAQVILACRSAERGAQAQAQITQATGNSRVIVLPVDLASQASIRAFCAQVNQQFTRLDGLIHNAANFDPSLKQALLTADGVETIFATNHIGVVLMTALLEDLLRASAPSRILTVASKGLLTYPFLDIEFDNLNGERRFSTQHAYYHAKLAQVMYTLSLAQHLQGSGVTVNCVRVTNVAIPDERLTHLPAWQRRLYQLKRRAAISPEQMARTYVYLISDPSVEAISGGYWDENNRQVQLNRSVANAATRARLWQVSRQMAGLED
jgi:NAD(P)-dependent dehydrogenase (short-subunit alcohol dehydrogenase family)